MIKIKASMQKQLLITVLDILVVVSNYVDIMRKVETEFTTTFDAYKYLEKRITQIKDRNAGIPYKEIGVVILYLMMYDYGK